MSYGSASLLGVVAKGAAVEVVVDHAAGLHEGVGGGGANEFPAALLEFFGEARGGRGDGKSREARFGEFFRPLVCWGDELPEEFVEAADFFNEFASALCVVDGCFNFAAMADNAGVG